MQAVTCAAAVGTSGLERLVVVVAALVIEGIALATEELIALVTAEMIGLETVEMIGLETVEVIDLETVEMIDLGTEEVNALGVTIDLKGARRAGSFVVVGMKMCRLVWPTCA